MSCTLDMPPSAPPAPPQANAHEQAAAAISKLKAQMQGGTSSLALNAASAPQPDAEQQVLEALGVKLVPDHVNRKVAFAKQAGGVAAGQFITPLAKSYQQPLLSYLSANNPLQGLF